MLFPFVPRLRQHLVLSVNRFLVVVHCRFYIHFPDDIWCGVYFYIFIFHLYIFFGEVFVQVFCPFLNKWSIFLLLSFKTSSYILDSSFYQICILQMFSSSLWLVFSFPCQWLLRRCSFCLFVWFCFLMKSSFSIISFMDSTFNVVSRRSLSHMLSSRNFIILCFIFSSVTYFKLIFVKSVKYHVDI